MRVGRRHLLKGATGAALMSVWTVNCSSSDGFNNSALDWQAGGVGVQAVSGSCSQAAGLRPTKVIFIVLVVVLLL